MPIGASYVFSDTVCLIRRYDGSLTTCSSVGEFPHVIRMSNAWLEDNIVDGNRVVYTSINLNYNYAARRHRDGNNLGPSIIKFVGDYQGGAVAYWENDVKSRHVEELYAEECRLIDIKKDFVTFDGCRAHEVMGFEGERYSCVFSQYLEHTRPLAT